MKQSTLFLSMIAVSCVAWAANQSLAQGPPYSGTVFIDSDILMSSDPTAFVASEYVGQSSRLVFDRRVNKWLNMEMMFLFSGTFSELRAQLLGDDVNRLN